VRTQYLLKCKWHFWWHLEVQPPSPSVTHADDQDLGRRTELPAYCPRGHRVWRVVFATERLHRIDIRGSPCGQKAGNRSANHEKHGDPRLPPSSGDAWRPMPQGSFQRKIQRRRTTIPLTTVANVPATSPPNLPVTRPGRDYGHECPRRTVLAVRLSSVAMQGHFPDVLVFFGFSA
jgi:hypothetical protein